MRNSDSGGRSASAKPARPTGTAPERIDAEVFSQGLVSGKPVMLTLTTLTDRPLAPGRYSVRLLCATSSSAGNGGALDFTLRGGKAPVTGSVDASTSNLTHTVEISDGKLLLELRLAKNLPSDGVMPSVVLSGVVIEPADAVARR